MGVGFRVLCRTGYLTIGGKQKWAPGNRFEPRCPRQLLILTLELRVAILGQTLELFKIKKPSKADGPLNLRAFLHEAHARQDLGGLSQSSQIVSREVGAGKGSVRPLARDLHHPHNATL